MTKRLLALLFVAALLAGCGRPVVVIVVTPTPEPTATPEWTEWTVPAGTRALNIASPNGETLCIAERELVGVELFRGANDTYVSLMTGPGECSGWFYILDVRKN